MKCPVCRKQVAEGSGDYPFCSERCRLIDLGNWASEKYVIPGTSVPKPESGEDEEE